FVLAELDYLIGKRVSRDASRALLDEVAAGAYQLEPFGAHDVAAAIRVLDSYRDLDLGLTDASVVVLAALPTVVGILTLHERHFRAIRTARGRSFRLLPLDQAA